MLGLFVAAAGFGTAGAFLESKETDELAMLDVNCRAVLLLSRHFGRRLVERGRGGMVLFGSLVDSKGHRGRRTTRRQRHTCKPGRGFARRTGPAGSRCAVGGTGAGENRIRCTGADANGSGGQCGSGRAGDLGRAGSEDDGRAGADFKIAHVCPHDRAAWTAGAHHGEDHGRNDGSRWLIEKRAT